jgi:hypothetical protein
MTTTTAILVDRYRIVVKDATDDIRTIGWFGSAKEAEDFAMDHRVRLGLNGCIEWYVEHEDAFPGERP